MNIKNIQKSLLENAKIDVTLMKNNSYFKARAIVDFQVFVIKGFVVRREEGKEWVNPPSIKGGRGWLKIFYCEDKDFWHSLQEKIMKAYEEAELSEEVKKLDKSDKKAKEPKKNSDEEIIEIDEA